MRESITKFDLEAAFKALDELDVPAVGEVKANKPALTEIFSRKTKFDALMEEYYDISNSNDLNDAKEARDAEIAKAKLARIEKIVDLDAKTPEDLLTSYVGKFIIQCPQCMTLFYKSPEDVEESEEDSTVVNVSEVCQHCGNESGYTLIGKVGEATEDEMENFDTSELEAEEGTEESEDDVLTVDVDGTDEEETEESIEDELNLDDEELNLDIEDDETEEDEDDKKEESFSNEHENVLVEQLTESSDVETSAEDFEKLISSPEFKKPISDTAVRAMMNEFDESLADSNATKETKSTYQCSNCGYETELYDDEYDGACPRCHEHHGEFNKIDEIDEGIIDSVKNAFSKLTEGTGADTANAIKDVLNTISKDNKQDWAKTVTDIIDVVPDNYLDDLFDIAKDKLADIKLDLANRKKIIDAAGGDTNEAENADTVGKVLALFDIESWDASTIKKCIVTILGIFAVIEPTPVVEIITAIVLALPADTVKDIVTIISTFSNTAKLIAVLKGKKTDSTLEEGIFDSKADKQKKYTELIKQVFEKDYLVVVNEVVISASDLLEEVAESFNDDGSASKTKALGIIKAIGTANQTINKTPHSLVKSIRDFGQKYKNDSNNLDTLKDFISKVGKLQSATKDGYKAMEFLFEKINKDLNTRLNKTIEALKREYSIVEELECEVDCEEAKLAEDIKNDTDIDNEEALTEAGLGTLVKALGKKAKQAGQNLKDKVSDAIDKFAEGVETREEKADWILANARKNYKNTKIDNDGELVPDEGNRKFKVFLVVGFEETYSNGKQITMPPSYNNKDLIIGMDDPKAFTSYKAADDSAKGWSMQQGNGPAFIYLAQNEDDDSALFLCQYFDGKLANDQLEKYFAAVKKDLEGANLSKGSEDKNVAQKSSEKNTKTTPTQASAVKKGMKVQLGNDSAEVTNVADTKNGKALTLTYANGNTRVVKVGNNATMSVVAESFEANTNELDKVMESLDELHENSLESFISNSLIEAYKNVAGFRLHDCNYINEQFVVDGIIHFTSGKTRKTSYTFTEALEENGKLTLYGTNEKLGYDKKFALVGCNKNNTFITESFKRI